MKRKHISTPNAPAAIGPYSQAVLAGDTLYCSGQIAIDPKTGRMLNESTEKETVQVLENLGAVLKAAGMSYTDVVRCTVYLSDMADYAQMNEVYTRYFSEAPPAREAVEVATIPREGRVEVSCIAVKTG